MEGGAVGPNSKSSWRGRKKGSIVSVSRRNTGGFSGQRSLSPVNQYPKLLFVKGVFLYYEGQTQGTTLSMPSLTMTEVDSHVHLHSQERSLVQNSGSCKFRNP